MQWFPFYIHRLAGDVGYRASKDYHQAWYLNLLFASWIFERPGYLLDDGQLWRLGAIFFHLPSALCYSRVRAERRSLRYCWVSSDIFAICSPLRK